MWILEYIIASIRVLNGTAFLCVYGFTLSVGISTICFYKAFMPTGEAMAIQRFKIPIVLG